MGKTIPWEHGSCGKQSLYMGNTISFSPRARDTRLCPQPNQAQQSSRSLLLFPVLIPLFNSRKCWIRSLQPEG